MSTVYDDWGIATHAEDEAREPATAVEAWAEAQTDREAGQ